MRLTEFKDVHPDWNVVRSCDGAETRSLLKLLITTMLLNGKVTADEREMLIDEFARMALSRGNIDTETVKHLFETTSAKLRQFGHDPEQFGPYIQRICNGIHGENKRIAALRLIAMLALSDGAAELELNFCRTVGHNLGLSAGIVDDIVRATWESRQRHLRATYIDVHRSPAPR